MAMSGIYTDSQKPEKKSRQTTPDLELKEIKVILQVKFPTNNHGYPKSINQRHK